MNCWTTECQQAFEHLKEKLTCAPTLGYADFTLPFVLETDASNLGLGAVLYQQQGGRKTVIAYASRRLRGAEQNVRNYSSMELELLALKWAVVEKFRSYLLGSKFTVLTDYNPLCHLNTAKLGAIEQRWVAQLAVFDFEVQYRPGRCNTAADALSRRPGLEGTEVVTEDSEFDGCVAICSGLHTGTAVEADLSGPREDRIGPSPTLKVPRLKQNAERIAEPVRSDMPEAATVDILWESNDTCDHTCANYHVSFFCVLQRLNGPYHTPGEMQRQARRRCFC